MNFENIIALILLYYLRKPIGVAAISPEWKNWLKWGMIVAVTTLVLQATNLLPDLLTKFIGLALIAGVVYAVVNIEDFHGRRSLVYALLPLIVISVISDIIEFVSPNWYKTLEYLLDIAGFFALIWAISMWFISRKQRKALELERKKAEEREKEFRITESLKAELEVQVAERTAALTQQKEALEKALNELKSTQTQLIHAEKMASLGELTAGIAHEIQNPLNFVNNFSEVSHELIQEMQEELSKGEIEEVKAIAMDLAQNLEKINHHGKRADAIVKGMLQHSRSNDGKKDLCDLNAIADEYLRLSYHGLRAKDKSFNSDFSIELDPDLPKVEGIPQELGRVILNLINNAFYAVNERSKNAKDEKDPNLQTYKPKVTISTSTIPDFKGKKGVKISLSDNGSGIPENIRSKIFQPFFTTKPTGQGTGLGLSLSYDIIKAHGGNLTLKSKEGLGTTFEITLPGVDQSRKVL
ncbi:ATP-binding protein [Pararhodonellum marinum]|uniref:ATP-binding protein n=1 Tax=Pararhodonellum marinum TaxID=2755358 RepID=UPI00188FAB36|nr:ATP-binding protein [Pararhodonellum marinum]